MCLGFVVVTYVAIFDLSLTQHNTTHSHIIWSLYCCNAGREDFTYTLTCVASMMYSSEWPVQGEGALLNLNQRRMHVSASRRHDPFAHIIWLLAPTLHEKITNRRCDQIVQFSFGQKGVNSKYWYSDGVLKIWIFAQDIFPWQENTHARALNSCPPLKRAWRENHLQDEFILFSKMRRKIVLSIFDISFSVVRHILRVFANLNIPPTYRGAFGQNIYPWKRKIIIQDQKKEKRSQGSSVSWIIII